MPRALGIYTTDPNHLGCSLYLVRELLTIPNANHNIGWGIGFYDNGEVLTKKRPLEKNNPLDLFELSKNIKSRVFTCHIADPITQASLAPENIAPFKFRNYLFGHAEDIDKFDRLKPLLLEAIPAYLQVLIKGETDSEIVFHLFMAFLHDAGKLNASIIDISLAVNALRYTITMIKEFSKKIEARPILNFMISNGRFLMYSNSGMKAHYRKIFGIKNCELCSTAPARGETETKFKSHADLQALYVIGTEKNEEPPKGFEPIPQDSIFYVEKDFNCHVVQI